MSDGFDMFNSDSTDNFSDVSLVENNEPRCPVVMVLDCSDSMTQELPGETQTPLQSLNTAIELLVTELHKDPLARKRVELAFVPFGTESTNTEFATVDGEIAIPSLQSMGLTYTAEALEKALAMIETRQKEYKTNGVACYQPVVYLISDGLSMSPLDTVSNKIKNLESKKRLSFFPIGVAGADMQQLSSIGSKQALMLKGIDFASLFQWISMSLSNVSASQVGDKVALPSPAGWAEM